MNFDNQARDWDNEPAKVERARIIANEITEFVQPDQSLDAFELGCGTGLLSYHLKDSFKTITLADNSQGMIEVLKEKIIREKINNFKPLLIDLLNYPIAENKYDVVYTLMTLHHIPDLNLILEIFNAMLNPAGLLCIADLVAEDGSFHAHDPGFNGHKGFDREELSTLLVNHGFRVESYKTSYTIQKEVNEKSQEYPLFLLICRKMKQL